MPAGKKACFLFAGEGICKKSRGVTHRPKLMVMQIVQTNICKEWEVSDPVPPTPVSLPSADLVKENTQQL